MDNNTHYRRPGWFTRNVGNRLVMDVTRLGLSVRGSRVLETRGRKSGLPRRTPVNLLELEDEQYLVAPRGETDWVRNVRADGGRLALLLGRKRQEYHGTEVVDGPAKIALLREYLKRWKAEVGIFFDGVGPDSSDEEIAAIADRHPVFQLGPS
jgi:deazaflavin-dependent oxidoreductase (nitroreductase family)